MDLRRMAGIIGIAIVAFSSAWPAHSVATDDDEFMGFLAAFRIAVAADDRAKLAALTRMPFLYEGRWVDAEEFATRVVPELFAPAVRRCLVNDQPRVEEDRYVIHCGPYGFYFGREAQVGAYRLQEFSADGEG